MLPFCSRISCASLFVCSFSIKLKYHLAPSPEGRPCPDISRQLQTIASNQEPHFLSLSHAACFCVPSRSSIRLPNPAFNTPQDPCVLIFHISKVIVSFVLVERLAPYPPPLFSRLQERFVSTRLPPPHLHAQLSRSVASFSDLHGESYTVLVTSARLRKTPRRPLSAPPPSCSIARARVSQARSATVVLFYYLKHPLSSNSQTDTLCLTYSGGPDSLTGTVSDLSCTFLEPRRLVVVSGRLALGPTTSNGLAQTLVSIRRTMSLQLRQRYLPCLWKIMLWERTMPTRC